MRHLCVQQKLRRLDAADLFRRCKRLIAVRQDIGALDDDEGVIEGAMAAVAACRKLIESARERILILAVDRFPERRNRPPDRLADRLAAEQLVDVVEGVFELSEL